MRWTGLALAALLMTGEALADETSPQPQGQPPTPPPAALPLKLPPHAQPTQREINTLPRTDQSKLGVDTSKRDQEEVDELYRQLTHEPPPPAK